MAKSKKPSLQSSLSSQQSRLKKRQDAQQAAAQQNVKKTVSNAKGKMKFVHPPLRPTIPFRATDKVLLVGEGNFSFARAMVHDPPSALEHFPSQNLTATAYDTEEECVAKYPDAGDCIQLLRDKGVEVLFNVDATKLDKVSALKGRRFDKIAWNFPHAGKGITDQDRNVLSNQILILGFLRSAPKFLTHGPPPQAQHSRKRKKPQDDGDDDEKDVSADEDMQDEAAGCRGSILITLRNVPPYTTWDVPKLAKNPPPPQAVNDKPNPKYALLRSFQFHRSAWKGYEHRMTKGERAHGTGRTGEGGEDRTWEFYVKEGVR